MKDDPNYCTSIFKLSNSSYRIEHTSICKLGVSRMVMVVSRDFFTFKCSIRLEASSKSFKVDNSEEVYQFAKTMCKPELVVKDREESLIEYHLI